MENRTYNFNINGTVLPINIEHENKEAFTNWIEAFINVMAVEGCEIKLEYVKELRILNRDDEHIATHESIIVKRPGGLQIINVDGDSHYGMAKDVLRYLESEQTWAYDYDEEKKEIHIF